MRARTPSEPTEREFQDQVIELAKMFGWRIAHFRPAKTAKGWRTPMTGDAGYPDLTLARERVIFAELKATRGTISEDQRAWGAVLEAATGVEYYLWRPVDLEAIALILRHEPKRALRRAPNP